MKYLFSLIILIFSGYGIYGQKLTQTIRGSVVDAATLNPLPHATIIIKSLDPVVGVVSDIDGEFRLEDVPVGRHNLQISYVGYKPHNIAELMVTSSKEVVLKVQLNEKVTNLKEATVVANIKKDKAINTMTSVSARTFSVEEAQRYAGGFDDPARLASSFAGVSTGYLDDNSIVVRGNAPKGLLWRLEGIEIPNPNHFAGLTTFGGGGVSALSSLMLDNSDFLTGAFPAEYGNAMSGVFDLKLRSGNNETYEHAVQLGAMGIDISSEGPLSKNNNASYLFNYRYSTFGIIKYVLPEEANLPIYQDFSFKLNLPTKKAGTFSIWSLMANDKIAFDAEKDTSLWKYDLDKIFGNATQRMGVAGVNHSIVFGTKTYLKSSLALSGSNTFMKESVLDYKLEGAEDYSIDILNYKYTFSSALNHKFSAGHSNRTGIIVNQLNYDNLVKSAPSIGKPMINVLDDKDKTSYIQFFSQSKIDLSNSFRANIGLHSQYFTMNKEFIAEPRIGLTYNVNNKNSISIAYGKHSRLEPQSVYLGKVNTGGQEQMINKDLRVSKSHHFVLAYDVSIRPQLRLKIEPYMQFLYDIPVIPDSSYSAINMTSAWVFTEKMTNEGTGRNYGIDFTLERFLVDGFYYLVTASVYDSKYVGGDGIERNTRYNGTFAVNILAGKEWTLGKNKNKVLGINGRLNLMGGQRMVPVNEVASLNAEEIVYDYSRSYENQKPDVYHLNASISYRVNKKKYSSIWSVQVINALGTKEFYGYAYNFRTNSIDEDKLSLAVPNISFKIEF